MFTRKTSLLAAVAALIGAALVAGETLTPGAAQADGTTATAPRAVPASAEATATSAPILLTVTDGARSLSFDRAALEALPHADRNLDHLD